MLFSQGWLGRSQEGCWSNGEAKWCLLLVSLRSQRGLRRLLTDVWPVPSPLPDRASAVLQQKPECCKCEQQQQEEWDVCPSPIRSFPLKLIFHSCERTYMWGAWTLLWQNWPTCASACGLDYNPLLHVACWSGVCKLDGGCCAADSDWNSTEVWVVHRPLVWALILYTQGRSGAPAGFQ